MKTMGAVQKAWLVNIAALIGLLIEAWRGAPWLAIAITALIFFPLANGLMYWKRKQAMRGAHE